MITKGILKRFLEMFQLKSILSMLHIFNILLVHTDFFKCFIKKYVIYVFTSVSEIICYSYIYFIIDFLKCFTRKNMCLYGFY